MWIVGQWQKCQQFDVSPAAWPGGKKAKKAAEKLLDRIFANGDHVTVLMALGLLMSADSGVAIRVCVYYCRTYYKAVCGGGGGQ